MEKGKYAFAGQVAEILSTYNEVHEFCKEYKTDEKPDFQIIITKEDIDYEYSLTDKKILNKVKNVDGYLEIYAAGRLLANKLLDYDCIMFHCSALKMNDDGYIFTAPSGTGKSTHSSLWKKLYGEKVAIINDDKPFIRINDNNAVVYGSPWSGKNHIHCNTSAIIKCIYILERGMQNEVESISVYDSFPYLYKQTYQYNGKKAKEKEISLLDKLNKNVKIYRLKCNISLEAAKIAYESLNGGTSK